MMPYLHSPLLAASIWEKLQSPASLEKLHSIAKPHPLHEAPPPLQSPTSLTKPKAEVPKAELNLQSSTVSVSVIKCLTETIEEKVGILLGLVIPDSPFHDRQGRCSAPSDRRL